MQNRRWWTVEPEPGQLINVDKIIFPKMDFFKKLVNVYFCINREKSKVDF